MTFEGLYRFFLILTKHIGPLHRFIVKEFKLWKYSEVRISWIFWTSALLQTFQFQSQFDKFVDSLKKSFDKSSCAFTTVVKLKYLDFHLTGRAIVLIVDYKAFTKQCREMRWKTFAEYKFNAVELRLGALWPFRYRTNLVNYLEDGLLWSLIALHSS